MASNPLPVPQRGLTVEILMSDEGIPTLVCRGRIIAETASLLKGGQEPGARP